ncbi:OsmC family protein [Nonlabens sp.]|uniref:OsmC family protein n=1 Tax=Nonlabens sp. TaxID=1888209 RepID=UPI0032673EB3
MKSKFHFEVHTQWQKDQFVNPKTHTSTIDGKESMNVSAAREFKGEPDKRNPEDLLLSALSSCHMMSYFYVCQQQGIEIIDYKDTAVGTLELRADSSGGFTAVQLNPVVTIKNKNQKTLAIRLHDKAHQLCFIANSVNFEISIQSEIKIL